MSIVEFTDLSFRYLRRKTPALKNINLSFEKGTTVAILGPAGAGKTTFVKALIGVVPHIDPGYLDGAVVVDGLNTRDHSVPDMARRVSLVLENPDVQIFSLTVKDDVAFGPANLGMPPEEIWKRVQYAMQETQLVGLDDRNPNNLSGGQQQGLAIAGALAMKPRVLAMDEPVAMIDPVGKERVMSIVERITKGDDTQATTIITESGADIEALAGKVDRVVALHEGEVVLDAAAEEALADPVLEKIGVGRPQVTELFLKLRNAGVKAPRIPVDLDGAVEMLGRLLAESGVKQAELPPDYGKPSERGFGEPVVRIENLHHTYPPDVRALRGVDLTVHDGQIVGIIGQNGSGKTTMARHLVGLLKPTNKDAIVQVMDRNVTKMRFREIIKMINYVFQNPDDQIFADTVWEEVAFAPEMMGFSEEEIKPLVEEALETFNLTGYEKRYTMALPQDLKTYLAIACVFPLKPQILLIDEPTTGLDTKGERVMMRSLGTLRDAGHTIVIITHNMKTIAEHCDRVVAMAEGEILLEGTPRTLFAQPERLLEAEIRPPQITQLGQRLGDIGFPRDVLTVDEMAGIVLHNLGRSGG
jgi:energy-coupling factor transporter ATP-binding protein EcfA2